MIGIIMGTTLKVGAQAPDFTVQDTQGRFFQLETLTKKGPVVLAFFPKAFTPT